jgi:ABC-type phosphate/phosphonate transport system substrate-binding protein
MKMKLFAAALLVATVWADGRAAELKIGIVQAQAGEARKYQPLLEYLAKRGVPAKFVTAPDYRAAADMFANGTVDAMFGGSGIAGTMILKGVADPLVRALAADGTSTYRAVVVAPKGSLRFRGVAEDFAGKRVICSALASAGEFFVHSLGRPRAASILKAASHGAAIDALSRGQADVAVVKNHVWEKEKAKYPALEKVGEDSGENPDGSLIVSKKVPPDTARALAATLIALGDDRSAGAVASKSSLGITGYVAAAEADYAHTLALLKRAGVTREFAFRL